MAKNKKSAGKGPTTGCSLWCLLSFGILLIVICGYFLRNSIEIWLSTVFQNSINTLPHKDDMYDLVAMKLPPALIFDYIPETIPSNTTYVWRNSSSMAELLSKYNSPTKIQFEHIAKWNIFSWNMLDDSALLNISLPMTRWQHHPVFVLGQDREKGGMIGSRKDSILIYTNITMTQFFSAAFDNETYLYWTGEYESWDVAVNATTAKTESTQINLTKSKGQIFNDWRDLRIKEPGIVAQKSVDESSATDKDDEEDLWRPMLWLSHPGVVAQTHYDTQHNVFLQVFGRKRFLLFPPETEMYSYPNIHRSYRQSQIHFEKSPPITVQDRSSGKQTAKQLRQKFPLFNSNSANTTMYEFILNPGDVLYIPPYWHHRVESLTLSLSLSVLSPSYTEASLAEVYWENVPFGAFQESRVLRSKAVILYLRLLMEELTERNILSVAGADGKTDESSQLHRFAQHIYATRFATLRMSHSILKEGCANVGYNLTSSVSSVEQQQTVDAAGDTGGEEKGPDEALLLEHMSRFKTATVNIADMLGSIRCRKAIKETFMKDYVEQMVRWAVGPEYTAMFIQKCLK